MSKTLRQAAALAIRDGLICMVTSRNGRRWVIPKGHVDPGHTAQDAARIEAWEEAGLIGIVDTEPIGTYQYEKYDTTRHVEVYVLTVIEEKDEWPEADERTREWVSVPVALHRIEEPDLRDLVRKVAKLQQQAVSGHRA